MEPGEYITGLHLHNDTIHVLIKGIHTTNGITSFVLEAQLSNEHYYIRKTLKRGLFDKETLSGFSG